MLKSIIAVVCVMAAVPAFAQSAPESHGTVISVSATAGSLGIGPQVGVRFSDHFGVRGSATFLNISADFDSDDVTYGGDLKLKSYGAMIDFFPFATGFRISAGGRINRNRVDVRAAPTGSFDIGEVEYTAAEVGTLSGRADFKKLSPAVTLGFGGSKRKGFFVGTEIGILFQGAAKLSQFTATGTLANNANFRTSLERERLKLQSDVNKVKIYPITQLTVGWRF